LDPDIIADVANFKVPYRKEVIEFFNMIFGVQSPSHSWWIDDLPPLLRFYFSITWYPHRPNQKKDMRTELLLHEGKGREILFRRIGWNLIFFITFSIIGSKIIFSSAKLTGLQFTLDSFDKCAIAKKWNPREPFGLLDLTDMGDRVKNMDIVSLSQGNFFFLKSLQEEDPAIVTFMLQQVC
jgi:hypothetical protein